MAWSTRSYLPPSWSRPRSELAARIARRPRFGIRLAERALNQGLDLQGQRASVEAAFGLHHLAHTHNRVLHDRIVDPGGAAVIRASAARPTPPAAET
ncbi:hypothetical protein [Pseudonocardia sp. NPDC049635]|uniref:hypothetical protein n=1 Tax=Pseudonocardia sp. NPDC049635 TaxID=3155506 RepID=UPI0033FE5344